MSEKELIALGAECVCGDLILDRLTVGRYRDGQFIMTEDGVKRLNEVVDVEARVIPDAPVRVGRQPKKAKDAEATKPVTEPVDETPAPESAPE